MEIKCFTFGPVAVNTYVLYKDTDAVIIDCGVSDCQEQDKLKLFLSDRGLTPTALLNTHMHFDHALGNVWAINTFKGIKCYSPHRDIEGLPPVSVQMGRFMMVESAKTDLPLGNYTDIKEDDVIRLSDMEIKVLEVPGHSPGHVAFFIDSCKSIFTGDVLFYESIGRTDLWGGSFEILLKSIKDKIFSLPDDVTVYPGHGEKTTIGHEKINNPFIY